MCYPRSHRPANHERHNTEHDNTATIRSIANPWHVIHLGMPVVRMERHDTVPMVTISPPPEDEIIADDHQRTSTTNPLLPSANQWLSVDNI